MKTTAKERGEVMFRLSKLGLGYYEAEQLRRIAMTLRNWFEYECGTGDDRLSLSIERDGDNGDGKPFMRRQFMGYGGKWQDIRTPIADREAGARKRLAKIMAGLPELVAYVQGDPRGASLYILRKSDIRDGEKLDQIYNRGVAVY